MKHGYRCECGWNLSRSKLTRPQYAAAKEQHAKSCELLKKELERSGKR
jgi:hypothetical protein